MQRISLESLKDRTNRDWKRKLELFFKIISHSKKKLFQIRLTRSTILSLGKLREITWTKFFIIKSKQRRVKGIWMRQYKGFEMWPLYVKSTKTRLLRKLKCQKLRIKQKSFCWKSRSYNNQLQSPYSRYNSLINRRKKILELLLLLLSCRRLIKVNHLNLKL